MPYSLEQLNTSVLLHVTKGMLIIDNKIIYMEYPSLEILRPTKIMDTLNFIKQDKHHRLPY